MPFSLWALHACLRYLVYRVSAAFDTCIRINQRTKRLGATMRIDLGNKLFPCLRACLWRHKLACGSHKHRNRAGGHCWRRKFSCMHAALRCPSRPRAVGGPDSFVIARVANVWLTLHADEPKLCAPARFRSFTCASLWRTPRQQLRGEGLCAAARLRLAVLQPRSSSIAALFV